MLLIDIQLYILNIGNAPRLVHRGNVTGGSDHSDGEVVTFGCCANEAVVKHK